MLNFIHEVKFSTSRSSGPGGQNVNKVNTKVTLYFDVMNSALLTLPQKLTIREKLKSKINTEGYLLISCEQTRSQLKNKELAIDSLNSLIYHALKPTKKRIATKPTKGSMLKRLQNKKHLSDKKTNRKRLEP